MRTILVFIGILALIAIWIFVVGNKDPFDKKERLFAPESDLYD